MIRKWNQKRDIHGLIFTKMVKQYNSKAVDMFQKSSLLCFNVLLSHVVFSENLSSKIAGQPRLQSVYIVENLFKYVENLS